MNRATRFTVIAALALLLLPGVALAGPITLKDTIDFQMVIPTSGSVNYAGGVNPLVGKKVAVDYVVGLNTPLHAGVAYNLIGGYINFTTGNWTGGTATSWDFAGGGSFNLYAGCLVLTTNPDQTCDHDGDELVPPGGPPGLIVSGFWSSATVTETNPGSLPQLKLNAGLVENRVWQPLLSVYGLTNPPGTGTLTGAYELHMLANGTPPGGPIHSTTLLSGDFKDEHVPSKIPEPASLILFGTGMIGIAGIVRRRMKRG